MSLQKLVLPASLLFSVVTGCGSEGQSDAKPEDFARPEGLKSALENPIVDCQSAALDCAVNAPDLQGRIDCNDGLAMCLQDAAARAQGVAQRVEDCREDGRVCLQNSGDVAACRDDYEACADAALNSGGADDAGSEEETDAGKGTDVVLDAGVSVPSNPGNPGINLPGLPGLGLGGVDAGAVINNLPAPIKCTVELRLCIATDPTAATQCADTARACLQIP